MEHNKKQIGQRINTALAISQNKQKDLAAHLGVKDNVISYFVSDTRLPSIEQLAEIADFCGVSSDYLLGVSDVATQDTTVQAVCNYTGLSEDAVAALHTFALAKHRFEQYEGLLHTISYLLEQSKRDSFYSWFITASESEANNKELVNDKLNETYEERVQCINNEPHQVLDLIFNYMNTSVEDSDVCIRSDGSTAISADEDIHNRFMAVEVIPSSELFERAILDKICDELKAIKKGAK